MSDDWNKNAEQVSADLRKTERQAEIERENTRQAVIAQASAREEERLQSELARKYKCSVKDCDVRCQRPFTYKTENGFDYGVQTSWARTVTDWSRPGDMFQCNKCKRCVCEKHIHAGICKDCANGVYTLFI